MRGLLTFDDAVEDEEQGIDEDSAVLGVRLRLRPERPQLEVFELWSDHEEAFRLFCRVQTQWRATGLQRSLGLDYAGVEAVMRMTRVPPGRRLALFDQLRVMEAAAVQAWAAQG